MRLWLEASDYYAVCCEASYHSLVSRKPDVQAVPVVPVALVTTLDSVL